MNSQPAFDEPAQKATYSISLISRTGTVSLANTDVESTKHLGAGGAFPRTDLLGDQFFQSETAKEVVGKTVKTEGKTETVVDKVEQDDADFKGTRQFSLFSQHATDYLTPGLSLPQMTGRSPASPRRPKSRLTSSHGQTESLLLTSRLPLIPPTPHRHIESSFTSPLTGKTIPLRVYATWDHIKQGQLALETTAKILPIYEEIFDIAYPLPKLDTLVASDFDAVRAFRSGLSAPLPVARLIWLVAAQGAMENWGLITGRTSLYLWDPKKSGLQAKKGIVSTQSHEVAHQWFGNVVTMEWWDNLWLNESFATLMGEVIIPDRIEPSWRVHSAFITAHLARALSLDALRSSHPVEMPCPNEETIQQIFDALTYSKGASCLKMLSNFVGEEKFLKGVCVTGFF